MQIQQGRRRRRSGCPLTRALGAACFAGATALSNAFITPGVGAGLHPRVSSDASATAAGARAVRVRRACPGSRQNKFEMASVAGVTPPPPPSLSSPAGAAGTDARRNHRRVPPLTVEEERALLAKIQEARLLRGLQQNLAVAEGGGMVTPEAWAVQADLSVEELKRVLQGGLDAKRTLVERNMPMVMRLVDQQYRWRLRGGDGGVTTSDLLQEGAYALGLAADRFDPAMPNRFLTYALFLVRDKLDNAIASGNFALSVPSSALKELHQARRQLTAELGRKPSGAEVAGFFTNVIVDKTREKAGRQGGASNKAEMQPKMRQRRLDLLVAVQQVASLDTPIRDREGNSIALVETLAGHTVDPLRVPGNGDISELIPKVLTRKQASLVRMACGLADGRPMNIAECSRKLSLSAAKTKAMLETSLEKLRVAAMANDPRLVMYK